MHGLSGTECIDLTGDDEVPRTAHGRRKRPCTAVYEPDCIIVMPEPRQKRPKSQRERKEVVDDDIVLADETGTDALKDLAHTRHHCGNHAFSNKSSRGNSVCCSQCYCFVCDVKASECKQWGSGSSSSHHCNAHPSSYWNSLKKAARKSSAGGSGMSASDTAAAAAAAMVAATKSRTYKTAGSDHGSTPSRTLTRTAAAGSLSRPFKRTYSVVIDPGASSRRNGSSTRIAHGGTILPRPKGAGARSSSSSSSPHKDKPISSSSTAHKATSGGIISRVLPASTAQKKTSRPVTLRITHK